MSLQRVERVVRFGGRRQRGNHRQVRLVFVAQFGDEANVRIGLKHIRQVLDFAVASVRPGCGFRRVQVRCVLPRDRSSRRSRREVTTTVSNNPDFIRRRDASCCNPMPRESMATSDATPTEMPMVVSEFRRTDSRRLRRASSVRSGSFIAALAPFVSGAAAARLSLLHRSPACHPPEKSGAGRSVRPGRARASPSQPSFPIAG